MTDKFRVFPVKNNEDRTYYMVQMHNGSDWVDMHQNGKPLSFKMEKMAILKVESLEKAAIHKFPL